MIIFGHFSRFLASFKISFSSLQNPNYKSLLKLYLLFEKKILNLINCN